MSDITACVVSNKSNEGEKLTLLTRWTSDVITFLIVRKDRSLFVGEIVSKDFGTYAEHFNKTFDEYMEETRDILSGKRQDVDFSLKDDKLSWKKRTWLLGQVKVKLTSGETQLFLDIVLFQTDYLSKASKKISEYEKSTESLNKSNSDLTYKINEMVLLKEQMETEWYRAILVVVNSMKAKIREQQDEIDKLKKCIEKDTVYDKSTDESDNEPNIKNDLTSQSVLIKKPMNKRLREESSRLSLRLSEKKRKIESETSKQNDVTVKEKEIANDENKKENTTKIGKIKYKKQTNVVITIDNSEIKKNNEKEEEKDLTRVDKEKLFQNVQNVENLKENEIASTNKQLKIVTNNEHSNPVHSKKDNVDKTQISKENIVSRVDPETIASTSKTLLSSIGEDEETPDILSDESYCEMELKLEEEKDDENEVKDNANKSKETTEIEIENKEKNKESTKLIHVEKEEENGENRSKNIESEEINNENKAILEQDSEEMVF